MVHTNEITPFSNAAGKRRNLPAPLSSAAEVKSAHAKTASAAMAAFGNRDGAKIYKGPAGKLLRVLPKIFNPVC
jgi:hypothetical protein